MSTDGGELHGWEKRWSSDYSPSLVRHREIQGILNLPQMNNAEVHSVRLLKTSSDNAVQEICVCDWRRMSLWIQEQ